MVNRISLWRRLVAEVLGTAMLLAAVVGSGIMAERLAAGNVAVALLANTLATGSALFVLILMFAEISGAHFNPVVTLRDLVNGAISVREAMAYIAAQISGAILGVSAANVMFDLPVLFASTKARTGGSQWFSEFIAAFGLIAVISCVSRFYSKLAVAAAVASYIMAAYWFTASTSFANPAVTIARSLSDTFAGIRPVDVFPFILSQLFGAAAATILFRWLLPPANEKNNE